MAARNSTGAPRVIPSNPTFTIGGKKRSAEFAQGVAAARAVVLQLAEDQAFDESYVDAAERMIESLALGSKGHDWVAGAVAGLCAAVAFHAQVGSPSDLWVPFSGLWRGEDGEVPPDDCWFYDVDGVPHAVEPNLHATRWLGEHDGKSVQAESIRGRAKPITRKRFEQMRRAEASHA